MKLIELLKTEKSQTFILLTAMYLLGALADGFGYFNWVVNMMGIVLQFAALPFIIINFIILFDSGILPARRSAIINLIFIFVILLFMILFWKLKMTAFLITSFILMLLNFIMLIVSMYRLSRLYIEVINDEKSKNNINAPRASITKFLKNINW